MRNRAVGFDIYNYQTHKPNKNKRLFESSPIKIVNFNVKIVNFNVEIVNFNVEIVNFNVEIDDFNVEIVNFNIEIHDFNVSFMKLFKKQNPDR